MPIMKEDDILRVDPGEGGALTKDGVARKDDEVMVVGTTEVDTPAGKESWTKVKLFVDVETPEGWVLSSNVDLAGVVPSGPIDKLKFANQCWVEALFSDANPHYVAAVAEMRSATSGGQQAGDAGPLSGPFRFTQAEWDAARAVKEFGVASYTARDIADWRMQVVLFTLMTHRTEAQLSAELNTISAGRRPSAAELYLAQIIGAKAAAVALTKPSKPTIKEAFDGVTAQAKDRPLGKSDFAKIVARYKEILETGLMKGEDAIDRIVARLDPVLVTTKPDIISAGTAVLGAFPEGMTVDHGSDVPFPKFDPSKGTLFDQKAPFIMRKILVDFPVFKDFHAAAILGNMGLETGGFTLMQEVRPRAGRGGLGWLQWTGPRRIDFETFCQPPNPSTATDEGNYNFMVHEMRGKERKARELFEVTTNLDDATQVFMLKYERPGVKALEKRKTFARRAFSLFRDAPQQGIAPSSPMLSANLVRSSTAERSFSTRRHSRTNCLAVMAASR